MDKNNFEKIIPPNDHKHRNGFTNNSLIDALNDKQKKEVENILISKLNEEHDLLIIQTLGYLKSVKALPKMYEILNNSTDFMAKLIIAATIFDINKDNNLAKISIESFLNLENKYQIISAFHFLAKFNDEQINQLIKNYTINSDFLISENAKKYFNSI